MQIYLVGGAVRNKLLNIPIQDQDWVVVGSTPNELIQLGYKPVGKDFPVFLHPETHEEYALARTERKTAQGYQGFEFYYAPDVTLADDLARRDLTINAIAIDHNNQIHDPYDGQTDIKNKIFKHVSDAFAEDPVRILRVGRFASCLPSFSVYPETNTLMKDMVESGEVDALVPERVWKELSRALANEKPTRFFDILIECNAQNTLWKDINNTCLNKLRKISLKTNNAIFRFAALCHSLSTEQLKHLIKTYKIPNDFSNIALIVNTKSSLFYKLNIEDAKAILDFIKVCDAIRQPQRFVSMCQICNFMRDNASNEKIQLLQNCIESVRNIDTKKLVEQGLTGINFKYALEPLQINAIESLIA